MSMNLKKIIENMDRMPSTLKGFTETPKLTTEQKKKLMTMVGRYNELGQKLKMESAFTETAQTLEEISSLAETYACNEANDWFASEVVKKDFKRAKGISQEYNKLARECYSRVQQLNALYEDMGHILARYYEIDDPMTEVSPIPTDIQSQRGLPNAAPETIVQEVKPNTSNLKSQREIPHKNGPAQKQVKEVSVNTSNLQSQRELPQGGPESCNCPNPTNPSVPVAPAGAGEMNVKGTREDPQGGPAPKQIKESNTEDSPKSETGTHGWEGGRAWRYDHKLGKRVWDTGTKPVDEVKPNTSNLKSQRRMPSLGDILRMK